MKDVYVIDEYVIESGKMLLSEVDNLYTNWSKYISLLKSLRNDGFCEGEMASALDSFIDCASQITQNLDLIGPAIDTACMSFQIEVEEASEKLYK